MPKITRRVFTPYTPEQMYRLVNDVAQYPRFLPACESVEILSTTPTLMKAKVVVAKGFISHTFVTNNQLAPFKAIKMNLASGPFKYLHGLWNFLERENGCEVVFKLDFEFSNFLYSMTLSGIVDQATNMVMNAFLLRAKEIYR